MSRLRTHIQLLERKYTWKELRPYWELLQRTEMALYKPQEWRPEAIQDLEGEIKEMLGVKE